MSWHSDYLDTLEQLSDYYRLVTIQDRQLQYLRASNERLRADPLIASHNIWADTVLRLSKWDALADQMNSIIKLADMPPMKRPWENIKLNSGGEDRAQPTNVRPPSGGLSTDVVRREHSDPSGPST